MQRETERTKDRGKKEAKIRKARTVEGKKGTKERSSDGKQNRRKEEKKEDGKKELSKKALKKGKKINHE